MENCAFYYDFGLVFLKSKILQLKLLYQKFLLKFFQGLRSRFCWNKKFSTKIINQNIVKLCFVLWVWISISKKKHVPVKHFP